MTPTEQDKGLREKIELDWLWLTHSCSAAEQKSVNRTLDKMMQLITADRKRVALEAYEKAKNYVVGFNRNTIEWIENDIAELKAQQEKL